MSVLRRFTEDVSKDAAQTIRVGASVRNGLSATCTAYLQLRLRLHYITTLDR
jgi:hypothetical protein